MARMRISKGRDASPFASQNDRTARDCRPYLINNLHGNDLVALRDGVDDGHVGDASKNGMDAVEVGRRDVGDKELTAAGVLARVGHRKRARRVLLRIDLALDRVAGAAGARAVRTSALDHEVLDDAVKILS